MISPKKSRIFFLLSFSISIPLHADLEETNWQRTVRSKALESIDKMLTWTFDQKQYTYDLKLPLQSEEFQNTDPTILSFPKTYGYFSDEHPLVAKVTDDEADFKITCNMLEEIHKNIDNPKQRSLMTAEILTKVLAYRDLKKGQEIPIPLSSKKLEMFEVETCFDLGGGMPAYGLMPKNQGSTPPLLLFRGTDLSLLSQRGLASMVSDLDPKGAGLSTFLGAQAKIHAWLEKAAKLGPKAKALGYSLGGAFTCYTLLYEYNLINQESEHASYAFNTPGMSKKIYRNWKKLPANAQHLLTVYVSKGDLISKIGRLVGDIYELSTEKDHYPIASHVTLMTFQPAFQLNAVDEVLENHSKRFFR